jgi:hypothetical protein
MSHVVLKPTPKPERSTMDGLYDATESLWMSVQRSWVREPKGKKIRARSVLLIPPHPKCDMPRLAVLRLCS